MYRRALARNRQEDHIDGVRRTVSRVTGRSLRRNQHQGCAQSPYVANGQQDYDRFGDADEQGPRSDRGALAFRFAARENRRRNSSAERYTFDGRTDRRIGHRGDGDYRYGDSGGLRVGVSRPLAARSLASAVLDWLREPLLRAAGFRAIPLFAVGLRGLAG